jgi:hypothetical protein
MIRRRRRRRKKSMMTEKENIIWFGMGMMKVKEKNKLCRLWRITELSELLVRLDWVKLWLRMSAVGLLCVEVCTRRRTMVLPPDLVPACLPGLGGRVVCLELETPHTYPYQAMLREQQEQCIAQEESGSPKKRMLSSLGVCLVIRNIHRVALPQLDSFRCESTVFVSVV